MTETKDLKKKNTHTISMLVANKPGVLVRIAMVFSRRAYNIDSLVVSPSFDQRFSRMTVTAQGDPETLEQIIKQVNKLVDVIHVGEHTGEDAVDSELAFVKIKTGSENRSEIAKLIKAYHAHIVDETAGVLIVAQVGPTEKLDELEAKLKKFHILEMVRTGKVVMVKGLSET